MNAIEAMSEVREGSRELLISTSEAESGSVLVAVSDSGPGLPHANPERIFDAFYTTKLSGLGMGLSICRSIVEAHGGRLWATPNEPHGAVFCMVLPIGEKSLESLGHPRLDLAKKADATGRILGSEGPFANEPPKLPNQRVSGERSDAGFYPRQRSA
jgi:Histidine kinase-, DNA gyrase B-, and HSP90-like ATPase